MAEPGTERGPLPQDHKFVVATKQVKSIEDMDRWLASEAYQEYLGFVLAVGEAIRGKKLSDSEIRQSDVTKKVIGLLDTLSQWVDEIPAVDQQARFGNKSYRDWHARLVENHTSELERVLDASHHAAVDEIGVYLTDSFGNATRIDYGTGHEMAFVMFLAALCKIGALDPAKDLPAIGLTIFDKYMSLVRKLQQVYRMEPAGSQGVWALDDYQFIPFIWGAAQLMDEARIEPRMIPDFNRAEPLAQDYHFFGCINYIAKVKTGPFAEHSNQLWNVSGVPTFSKVYTGLIKMYRVDVLAKFPIIQHTFFGSIFTLARAEHRRATDLAEAGPARRRMGPPGSGQRSLGSLQLAAPPPVTNE